MYPPPFIPGHTVVIEKKRAQVLGVLEVVVVVVTAAQHGEVGHLEGVGGAAAALQGARHRVPHVEVRLRHVRCQV